MQNQDKSGADCDRNRESLKQLSERHPHLILFPIGCAQMKSEYHSSSNNFGSLYQRENVKILPLLYTQNALSADAV